MRDEINKPNPKHYKLELRNIPVIIDGEEKIVDSLHLETRYILKDIVNDINITREQAVWYWDIGKRYFRLFKKHDNPTTDLKKIIQVSTFLLSSLLGENINAKLIDESGDDLLNGHEEIATIDKLKDLLNSQEQEFIQDKKIKCVVIDGMEAPMDIPREVAQDLINRLGDIIYGEN
jgi:hypothetical protein